MTQWQIMLQNLAVPVYAPPQPLPPKEVRLEKYIMAYLATGAKVTSSIANHLGVTQTIASHRLRRLESQGRVTKEVRIGYGKGGKGGKTNLTYWTANASSASPSRT
jgi:DNA-binding MarR family transcriptional regulator